MEDFKQSLKVKLPIKKLSDSEAKETYERFVSEQEEQFLLFINYLNRYINELRDKGIISPFLEFYARIKATNSALKNYNKKALDDVFGIEFICATDTEIKILQKELERILKVYKEKVHNKGNGYKAIHHSCSMREDVVERLNAIAESQQKDRKPQGVFPALEVQYKTIGVYYEAVYGKASHEKYKEAELSKLQILYDKDKLKDGEDIPYTWISNPNGDEARKMSKEEVLKKMYPSLDLRREQVEEIANLK